MLKGDGTGRFMFSFENEAVIRRIPLERRGVTNGREWVLGSALFEVFEGGMEGSAEMYLITFNEELIEQLNRIGIGKRVKIGWHIETRPRYDSYNVSAILDSIQGCSDGENFIYGTKEKGE